MSDSASLPPVDYSSMFNVAGKVADTIPNDNDDDDDSCFIQTVSENSNVTRHIAILPGVFMVMGIAGYLLRRK